MIDIIQTPAENKVFTNTAPIHIIVDSTRGLGYYFQIKIYQNGALYHTQPRSKTTEYRCEIDFSGLVSNIFSAEYTEPTTTNVTALPGLLKQISVTVQEYQESTDALVDELELPMFYLINADNESPLVFNQLQPLSIYTDVIKVPEQKFICFPFFAIKETIVKLYVNNQLVQEFLTENAFGVYQFQCVLSDYNITENDAVHFQVYDGTNLIEKQIVAIASHYYNVQQLVVKNNFSAWEPFYCFGKYQDQFKFVKKSHQITDVLDSPYKSTSRKYFYLNTGNYHTDYAATVANVLNSTEASFLHQDKLVKVKIGNSQTTKIKDLPDYVSTDVQLANNQEVEAENTVLYQTPDSLNNITVTGEENSTIEVLGPHILNAFNGETPADLQIVSSTSSSVIVELVGSSENVEENKTYSWSEFTKLSLVPNDYGTPFVTLNIRLLNANGWSNTAKVYINVFPDLSSNRPPEISLASSVVVRPSEISKTINATVTEPDGHNYSLLWVQESGQPLTMNNATTASLQITNWSGVGNYEFKLIATDEYGASAEKTITVQIMNYEVNALARGGYVGFYGGKPGTSIDWAMKIEFKIRDGQAHGNYQESDTVELFLDQQSIATAKIQAGSNILGYVVTQPTKYFQRTDTFDEFGKIEVSLVAVQSVSGSKDIIAEWHVSEWVESLNDVELELGNLSKISFMNEYES